MYDEYSFMHFFVDFIQNLQETTHILNCIVNCVVNCIPVMKSCYWREHSIGSRNRIHSIQQYPVYQITEKQFAFDVLHSYLGSTLQLVFATPEKYIAD